MSPPLPEDNFDPQAIANQYLLGKPKPQSPLSEDEDYAVRTIIGEARDQGQKGWDAVAGVIRNRAQSSGDSLKNVVLAPSQFEPWAHDKTRAYIQGISQTSPLYQQVAQSVVPVLRGEKADPTGGADHFYSPGLQSSLGRAVPSFDNGTGVDIGAHRFFKLGYKGNKPVFDPHAIADQYLNDNFDADSIAQQYLQPQTNNGLGDEQLDNKGGHPISPTVLGGGTVKSPDLVQPGVSEEAIAPIPETPDTIQAQVNSIKTPSSKRFGVLPTDESQAGILANSDLKPYIYQGQPIWIDEKKAKKGLGLKDHDHIQAYLDKNPKALMTILGTPNAPDVGNDTGGNKPAITTTLMKNGVPVEGASTVITNPAQIPGVVKDHQKQFPQGQTKLTTGDEVIANRLAIAQQPVAQPTEADFQAYRENQGLEDNAESRQAFKTALAVTPEGHTEVSANPQDFTFGNGDKLTDHPLATPAQGGEGYIPKEIGKENDDLNGTAYVFHPDPKLTEEQAAKAAYENAADANGVAADWNVYKTSRKGKSLFPTGYQPGDTVSVSYQALKDGGGEIDLRTPQVQNRVKSPVASDIPEGVLNAKPKLSTAQQDQADALGRALADNLGFVDMATGGGSGSTAGITAGVLKDTAEGWLPFIGGLAQTAGWLPDALTKAITGNSVVGEANAKLQTGSEYLKRVAQSASRPENALYEVAGELGSATPRYIGVGALTGGNPILTFGGLDALTAMGRGDDPSKVLTSGVTGGLTGLGLGALSKVGEALGSKLLPIVTIPIAGFGVSAAQGGDWKENSKQAGIWMAMEVLGHAIGHAPDKLTEADAGKVDGHVFRVPDPQGNPRDVLFRKGKDGLEVKDVTAEGVPDDKVSAIVLPKVKGKTNVALKAAAPDPEKQLDTSTPDLVAEQLKPLSTYDQTQDEAAKPKPTKAEKEAAIVESGKDVERTTEDSLPVSKETQNYTQKDIGQIPENADVKLEPAPKPSVSKSAKSEIQEPLSLPDETQAAKPQPYPKPDTSEKGPVTFEDDTQGHIDEDGILRMPEQELPPSKPLEGNESFRKAQIKRLRDAGATEEKLLDLSRKGKNVIDGVKPQTVNPALARARSIDDGTEMVEPQDILKTANALVTQDNEHTTNAGIDKAPPASGTSNESGEGTKETKPSKIGKSIEAKAIEAGLTEGFRETAGYTPIVNKDEIGKATDLMAKDMDSARAMIRGERPVPEGVKPEALLIAMEKHAELTSDPDLHYETANSPITSESSKHAQSLQLFRERDPDSAAAYIQDVRQQRAAGIKKLLNGRTVEQALEDEVNGISKSLKFAKKKPIAKEVWDSFIDNLAC